MIFLYFLAIFISLFILYAVSRHDFVLLRQSISLRSVFDNALLGVFAFLFASRIFYILYTGVFELFNPLKFFYLTAYWGILPFAGIITLTLTTFILFRKKKNKLRILDIYLISITPVIILDVLLYPNSFIMLLIKAISILVLVGFYAWFIKIHNKFSTKDGFITMMTLITYSLVTLSFSLAQNGIYNARALVLDAVLITVLIISSILLFLVQKDIFSNK